MTQVLVTSPTSRVLVRGGGGPVAVGYASGTNALRLRGRLIDPDAPTIGQALVWDGAAWAPADIGTQIELDALTATVAAHVANVANPHAVTAAQVGAYTTAQADVITDAIAADLAAHVADVSNPHAVTAAQVGLGNVENTALSTWAGSGNITTVGTLVAGAVLASLVTEGTFPGNEYVFGTTGVRTSVTNFSGGVANGALLTRGLTKVHSVDGSTNYSAQFGGIVAQVRGISNSAAGCSYTMARTRSPTEGTYSALVNNDHIGSFIWIAADGTDLATNVVRLRTEVAGTISTSRVPGRFLIQVAAGATDDDIATRVTVTTAATSFAGNLLFDTDNTYDIGASGATRPRDLFLGRNATIAGNLVMSGQVQLRAGTTAAGTAPLVFTSGTNLTTAVGGRMEYNNTYFLTNSDATRRDIVLAPNATKVVAAAPYANDGYVVMNIRGTDFKVMTTA